jgi:hypothetical protein
VRLVDRDEQRRSAGEAVQLVARGADDPLDAEVGGGLEDVEQRAGVVVECARICDNPGVRPRSCVRSAMRYIQTEL